jgi:FixJ family two-component response regulator
MQKVAPLFHQPLVAIIDDDDSLRDALSGLVRSLGYTVQLSPSADLYIPMMIQERPDCIVTDIQMPGMDGIAFKHWLDDQGHAIPLIMITARTEESLLARAREAQPFCLLRKPFDADQLIGCIDRALAEG